MGADREASGREAGLNPFPTTETLSRFLAESRWEGIPAAIRHEGKRGLLNALGCILAGREDPAVAIVRRVFPLEDALIDAAAATAHDYDDTHLPTVIHATPPVAAAVLSIARKQKVSGAELLHAFVLGVETTCRMGNAVMPGHYERGWHITSTCGVFGATAAAAKLLRLDERQVASALGLAATQASGLVEMLGSMARVLNAGFAVRHALETGDGIQVELHPLAIERTNRPEPRNAIEARLSAQHAVAVALLHGDAGLAQFSDAAAIDGEVRALRRRIGVAADPSLDKMAARIRADGVAVEAPE